MTVQTTSADIQRLFDTIAGVMTDERDNLCQLDGVIGDADHGIAMELGFNAAATACHSPDLASASPTVIFNTAAKAFLNSVGASSGPLYATAFMRAGAAVKGKASLDDHDMVEVFIALAKGIQDRGKAEVGEKTMVDAWAPAADACAQASINGASLQECLSAALAAAQAGCNSTRDMIASKGRSARLGARSLGHIDPGAASATLIISCINDFVRTDISVTSDA